MRRVQAAALDLFEEHGFAAVTVEEIAARASVGPATVYRNFGAKERIVLWDDYDPALMDAIAARLPADEPLAAVRAAILAALEGIYAEDGERILRRARLITAEPALTAAAAADHAALVAGLSEVFAARRSFGDALERDVAARAVAGALEAAVLHWVRRGGRRTLGHLLSRAFERLATLR
jgi:AcrR family transcriptional regulator